MSTGHTDKPSVEDFRTCWLELHKGKVEHIFNSYRESCTALFNAFIDYSKIAINGVFLLNGAAGIAILYNLKTLGEAGTDALKICACGALLAVLCAGFAYITQRIYTNICVQKYGAEIDYFYKCLLDVLAYNEIRAKHPDKKGFFLAHAFLCITCLLWICSCSCFGYIIFISNIL